MIELWIISVFDHRWFLFKKKKSVQNRRRCTEIKMKNCWWWWGWLTGWTHWIPCPPKKYSRPNTTTAVCQMPSIWRPSKSCDIIFAMPFVKSYMYNSTVRPVPWLAILDGVNFCLEILKGYNSSSWLFIIKLALEVNNLSFLME